MNLKIINYTLLFLFTLVITAGCKSKNTFDEDISNVNKGTLNIYADESYHILLDELIQSYENVYPESDIIATYGSDAVILQAMFDDKTRMLLTGRNLSKNELAALEKINGIPIKQFTIGKEAIAVITSQQNTDSIFNLDEFLSSTKTGYQGKYASTSFVFNTKNSGMVNQLLGDTKGNFTNLFSLDNTDTLVAYIAANPKTVGFISFAEISDTDDSIAQQLLSGNKVLAVAYTDSTGKKTVTELSQSTIMTNKYPLLRNVTVIKGNTSQLLGTGFVNFLYRSKASRIILKSGLIPTKMTERQVNIVE